MTENEKMLLTNNILKFSLNPNAEQFEDWLDEFKIDKTYNLELFAKCCAENAVEAIEGKFHYFIDVVKAKILYEEKVKINH